MVNIYSYANKFCDKYECHIGHRPWLTHLSPYRLYYNVSTSFKKLNVDTKATSPQITTYKKPFLKHITRNLRVLQIAAYSAQIILINEAFFLYTVRFLL